MRDEKDKKAEINCGSVGKWSQQKTEGFINDLKSDNCDQDQLKINESREMKAFEYSYTCTGLQTVLTCPSLSSRLPLSWKSQEKKWKFFKVVGKLFKKSVKIFDIVKVSEKSGSSVFRFIVHKCSSRLRNAFPFGEDEKYAAKQA